MIRNHRIVTISYSYRAQYRAESSTGYSQIVTEQGVTTAQAVGIFPSEEHARLWAKDRFGGFVDFEIINLTSVRPDACVIEYTW